MAAVLKTARSLLLVGSNPTPSAPVSAGRRPVEIDSVAAPAKVATRNDPGEPGRVGLPGRWRDTTVASTAGRGAGPGRGRSPGRQWLSFCRDTFEQRHGVIRAGKGGDLVPHPFRVQPIGPVREHIGRYLP